MTGKLTSLFETGKGNGNELCNFFAEDQVKEFVGLWSGLLEKLLGTIQKIKTALVGRFSIEEEKIQCDKHLKQWLK